MRGREGYSALPVAEPGAPSFSDEIEMHRLLLKYTYGRGEE